MKCVYILSKTNAKHHLQVSNVVNSEHVWFHTKYIERFFYQLWTMNFSLSFSSLSCNTFVTINCKVHKYFECYPFFPCNASSLI